MFRKSGVAAAITVILLAGCAEIPRSELGAYTRAFDTAKQASEQVMLDLSVSKKKIEDFGKKEQANQKTQSSVSVAAGSYVPRVQRIALAKPDGITARLSAFGVIDAYNTLLVNLASGQGIEKVKASASNLVSAASRLASAAGAAIPGLSAAAGLIKTAAAAAEKYRARKEFARLVREGGPKVRAILQFLIEDTVTIVNIHEGIWVAEMAPLRLKASNSIREISALARNKRRGPTTADGKQKEEAIETKVKSISGRTYSIRWSTNAAHPPADAALFAAMNIKLSEAKGHYTALFKVAERSPALRMLMDRYTDLLGAADAAMANLEKGLDKPVDVSQSVLDLLDTAMALKREYATFRAAL